MSSAPLSFRMLLVDDDATIRESLKDYLTQYHSAPYTLTVDEAATASEATRILKENAYDLVICDINLPDKDGFHVLRAAEQYQPGIRRALITAYDLNSYIDMVKSERVYNIITKTAPFNFTELSMVVNNLLQPEKAFGLQHYLTNPTTLETMTLKSSDDIIVSQKTLEGFFRDQGLKDIDALAVVMIEAITNAVYHASHNPDGSLRYRKGEPIASLAPEEYVTVAYGKDAERIGVAICDQGGTMEADDILYWLERNINATGESLMDTHGRGVFLIHRLIDRVVINLAKGRTTELILLHSLTETSPENKPLYINELPAL